MYHATGCIFNCEAHRSCQTNIICPESGEYCEINCFAGYSCYLATINSQNSQNVVVNFIGDYSGAESTIYTPGNGGNIHINVQTASRGFRYGNIAAILDTNEIHVLCSLAEDETPTSFYYDCDSISIHALNAQYLNVTAVYNSEFTYSVVDCPLLSYRQGTSCNIDCSYVLLNAHAYICVCSLLFCFFSFFR